jgi:hypothetical protein
MAPAIFGLIAFGAIALLFALFSRGGPRESGARGVSSAYGPARLAELSRSFLESRGLSVSSVDLREPGRVDLLARDPRPGVGQTLYVRVVSAPDPVGSTEVQAAADRIKGEGYNKALVVSESGFSDEAVAAAEESAVELMEAESLARSPAGGP